MIVKRLEDNFGLLCRSKVCMLLGRYLIFILDAQQWSLEKQKDSNISLS